METPSRIESAGAAPLPGQATTGFVERAPPSVRTAAGQRIGRVARTDLSGLPPATVVGARIGPLRSKGETCAADLRQAGIPFDPGAPRRGPG